ncbi:MAG: hypothetical protein ABI082_02830 [Dokdonella sp.]
MVDNAFAITREFVNEVIDARVFTVHVANLAIELAKQAGEPVSRPLSQAQIERAVLANGIESRLVMDALITRLEGLHREGKLPEEASLPRW